MKSPPERISCSPGKKGADPIPYGGLTRVGLLGDIVPPDAEDMQGSRYARRQAIIGNRRIAQLISEVIFWFIPSYNHKACAVSMAAKN